MGYDIISMEGTDIWNKISRYIKGYMPLHDKLWRKKWWGIQNEGSESWDHSIGDFGLMTIFLELRFSWTVKAYWRLECIRNSYLRRELGVQQWNKIKGLNWFLWIFVVYKYRIWNIKILLHIKLLIRYMFRFNVNEKVIKFNQHFEYILLPVVVSLDIFLYNCFFLVF